MLMKHFFGASCTSTALVGVSRLLCLCFPLPFFFFSIFLCIVLLVSDPCSLKEQPFHGYIFDFDFLPLTRHPSSATAASFQALPSGLYYYRTILSRV